MNQAIFTHVGYSHCPGATRLATSVRYQRGVTLIEILLFGSISATLLLWLSSWLTKPTLIQQQMLATFEEREALRLTDALVNDLKQMIPGTLRLESSTGQGPLTFQIAGPATPPGESPGTPVTIRYSYEPPTPGLSGSWTRIVDGTPTVVLNGLEPPMPMEPMIQQDPALRIITMSLRLKMMNGKPLRVVRRVAVPN